MSDPQVSPPRAPSPPFAITHGNIAGGASSRRRTTAAVVILAAMLLLSFTGLLGGGAPRRVQAEGAAISGELAYDAIVRSGNWFETRVTLRASADVRDLTIAVDDAVWRKMSIDTMAPDAESAEALDGEYAYHFGEVKAGETFDLKLDGQIQPGLPRRQSGAIRVRDGERPLLQFPVSLTVLP